MAHFLSSPRRLNRSTIITCIVMLGTLLLSACGGNPQTQQQADNSKAILDKAIAHAQNIGVPNTVLTPIIQQETQLSNTTAPIPFFNGQTDYYANITQRYQVLAVQVQGLETQITQQLDYQAALDLQNMESILAQRQAQDFVEAKTFARQFTQYQSQLAKAQYPKDYIQVSNNARRATLALHLMGSAYSNLVALQQDITQLKASHLDTTALTQEYQQDLQAFRYASTPEGYSQLIDLLTTQLQATTDFSTQAIPYVGAAKLQEFSADVVQMKLYGLTTATYQQHLNTDQIALAQAQSFSDYLKVSTQIDHDMASLQFSLIQGKANYLLKQFHTEVTNWGNTHQYHDPVDGGSYNLDYEYDAQGIGSDADTAVQSAQTSDDYQSAIDLINGNMLNLKAMESDYNDKTPYNQPHATDIALMKHYGVYGSNVGQVLVVSLLEQTLRYYNNGKLVHTFYIVSGQYLKPSPPGFWHIFLRQHPTQFKSSEPPGSAFWYPPTPIQYAMEYHEGGYFFHDAWWRDNFGPGDNFPHYDAQGTDSFNSNGSHGCINMNSNDIAWLYTQIPWGAAVILY